MTISIPSVSSQPNHSANELLEMYRITEAQLDQVRALRDKAMSQVESVIERFYVWMAKHPDMMAFFPNEATLRHVQKMQIAYWDCLMQGKVDDNYVEDRKRIGEIHARIGLPVMFYMAGASMIFEEVAGVHQALLETNEETISVNQTVANLLHLDAGIICQSFVDKRDQLLHEQSEAVMSMSTPVTEIWDGILLLPIVGIVDSKRSEDIMNAVLECIRTSKAKEFILDISGVGVVDTAVANYLINITKATALMGCRSTISGISPAISKTIVQLGIDVGDINTTSTMMDALASAFDSRGISIMEDSSHQPARRHL
jgi:rsbT co-antagonist protein RsbR